MQLPVHSSTVEVATVSLVNCITVPSQMSRVLQAWVTGLTSGYDVLFEPEHKMLPPLGLNVPETVVTANERG